MLYIMIFRIIYILYSIYIYFFQCHFDLFHILNKSDKNINKESNLILMFSGNESNICAITDLKLLLLSYTVFRELK